MIRPDHDDGQTVRTSGDPDLLVIVDTPNGTHVRSVAPASSLPDDRLPGAAAESATRSAASFWGMPDFVYAPVTVPKGASQREVSDGLLIQRNAGVVIQVKHRAKPSDRQGREARWLRSKTEDCVRQVNGTIRTLATPGLALRNHRGRVIDLRVGVSWSGVIILDHPSPPEGLLLDASATSVPTLVLLRRDWEFLFEQLRSTAAVISYLRRATDDGAVALGEEPVRYYQLADADEQAVPQPPTDLLLSGWISETVPLLPKAPAGQEDTAGHLLLRAVMEDVALSEGDIQEDSRIDVLSELDTMPVASRAMLGRHLMNILNAVSNAPDESLAWQFRLCRFRAELPQLLFGGCNQLTELSRKAFGQWVMLRHHEFGELVDNFAVRSVAVLLTPNHSGDRPFDTTMMSARGDLHLSEDELIGLRNVFNVDHPSPYAV